MRLKIWFALLFICIIIEALLVYLGMSIISAGIIAFFVILAAYTFFIVFMSYSINNTLEEKCDPYAFIEKCERFKAISKRPAFHNVCILNTAVGNITLNKFDVAEEMIKSLNMDVKNSRQFTLSYHLALFCIHLHNNEAEKALAELEAVQKIPRKKAADARFLFLSDIASFEYQCKFKRTPEALKENLKQLDSLYELYTDKLKKRQKLSLLHTKAEMLMELGESEQAAKIFKKVAENGNKLWVAESSRLKLKEIK